MVRTRLPRFGQTLCHDLAIWMVGLDLSIGLVFPLFMYGLGFPSDSVFSPRFILASIGAGAVVAAANFAVARLVVAPRLRNLSSQARHVEAAIRTATATNDWRDCTPEQCQLTIESKDEIGEIGRSFNDLVDALLLSHAVEAAVNEFSQHLTGKLELRSLSADGLDHLMEHTEANAGAVIVEQAGDLSVTAGRGIKELDKLTSSEPVLSCMASNRKLTLALPTEIRLDAVLTDFRPREVVLIPLAFKGVPLGLFLLARAKAFSQHAHRMMQLFQQSFALALNSAQAHQQLQTLTVIDPLTGLYNRRFGMSRLLEEMQRAKRIDSALSVMMIDIDHFKSINDTHGHLVGDRVLVQVAGAIRGISRESDVVVRYGGEEFLILSPGADGDNAVNMAQRFCDAVSKLVIKNAQLRLQVTVSIGLARFPADEEGTPEAVLSKADEALYRAKQAGRNQVHAATGSAPVVPKTADARALEPLA